MPSYKKKVFFDDTDEGQIARQSLALMDADDTYNTQPGYSANSITYPDNVVPFIETHMAYLRAHPATNPQHYISNLRLMTRIR